MGGQREYLQSGGFSEYLYRQEGETLTANGISGKVISKQGSDNAHDGLPKYSNTSKVYFKLDDVTRVIEQARVYENRKWVRSNSPRLMNNNEIAKYGDLLKKANPNVRFR